MSNSRRIPTRVLLVCAAIGVATGLVSAAAGWISLPIAAVAPVIYGLVLGSHVLPGVVAQELLRRPWVALITHLVAALAASAFSPQWIGRYLGAALLIGGIQEGVAALTRYRAWQWWRFLISAVIVGAALAVPVGLVADLERFPAWAGWVYIACFVLGPVLWSLIGFAVGRGLRRAGIAQHSRGA